MVLVWENLQRFLFILLLLVFIYLHLSMFFILLVHLISRLLYHVTGTPPWLLRPVMKVSTSSELSPDYFWLPFLFHLPRVLWFWVVVFYPQPFFTLHSFLTFWAHPNILAQPAFIKVSLGAGSCFLESCRASCWWSLKHRPGPSVCLIHSNLQSFIHVNIVFMHIDITKVLLMVKTLMRSAATPFSSHENIK